MATYTELAKFVPAPPEKTKVGLIEKVEESKILLSQNNRTSFEIIEEIRNSTIDDFRNGFIPRISPFDILHLPEGARLVKIPNEIKDKLALERSYDLIRWNSPRRFLNRLITSKIPFVPPAPNKYRVMDRLEAEGKIVSFENLRVDAPHPKNGRQSRTGRDNNLEINIMGQARVPFALGSVPDVGSFLSYVTMAQANGMVFISRDKVLSDVDQQAQLVKDVISYLKTLELPKEIDPSSEDLHEFAQIMEIDGIQDEQVLRNLYYKKLRETWIQNVGAAIEASENSIRRVEKLREAGCKLFRIYSPEGGIEIVETVKMLRNKYPKTTGVKIVAGQIMDQITALAAQKEGADALMIGVAGGSQCTTSKNADIPVKTPNLLYQVKGKINIPIGIEGGGVGTHIMTAFALGASFVSKPGEIGVSWEGAGGKYMFEKDGEYYMVYGGEASISAKWWKDSVDAIGRPKFVEGETGVRKVPKDKMSMTGNIKKLRDQLAIGLVFQRVDSISELHKGEVDNIVEVTPEASALSGAYGQ